MQGHLITLEGTEGAGKSTLARGLAASLTAKGIQVTQTREPGGSPLAEKLRALVLHEAMPALTELFIMQAARSSHWAELIWPKIQAGHWVICDRFIHSSLAYQAAARGLDWGMVSNLNTWACLGHLPSLTFWLDMEPEIGLKRAKDPNRFEAEGLVFQKKVRQGFQKAFENPQSPVIRLDSSSMPAEQVLEQAWSLGITPILNVTRN